jgi:hypothetical protein
MLSAFSALKTGLVKIAKITTRQFYWAPLPGDPSPKEMYNTYHADVQTEASRTQRFAHTLKLSIASEWFATTVCQCA